MKKYLILIICLLLFTGCTTKKVEKKVKKVKEETKEEKIVYKDENMMPISFYENNKKITTQSVIQKVGYDLGVFQIFPSNEDTLQLNKSHWDSFYEEWNKYDTNHTTKIGYNVSFTTTDGKNISYNILSPTYPKEYDSYMMPFLYDDYNNRGKSWYSHVEENEYNENTFLTSIKLFANGDISNISSNINLTVFTYDTEDDFDPDTKEYRGNSKATLVLTKK